MGSDAMGALKTPKDPHGGVFFRSLGPLHRSLKPLKPGTPKTGGYLPLRGRQGTFSQKTALFWALQGPKVPLLGTPIGGQKRVQKRPYFAPQTVVKKAPFWGPTESL